MKSRFALGIFVAVVAGLFTFLPTVGAAFTVTQTDDPNTLINSLIQSGITIVGTPTYTGANQAGTFTDFSSGPYTNVNGSSPGFSYSSGIILSSGYATAATTPYPSNSQSAGANGDMGGPGNALLSAVIGQTTYDASVLQFQFTSTNPNLYFHFAFASTEYPQFIGAFNDVFGFFLNGVNIALLPDGITPISVNSVNASSNPQYFTQYSGVGTPFNYGGLTTDLTINATVIPGQTYTMTLGVADALDHVLDSAILIEGGSFGGNPTPTPTVPEPVTLLLLGSGLLGLVGLRKKF